MAQLPPGSQAERAERARLVLGTTKEVIGFIDFIEFEDFLGFPILLLGFHRIS